MPLAFAAAACDAPQAPAARHATVTRSVGSWQGTGNRTIGFLSDSGRFRVTWQTRHERLAGAGTFRLVVHSAVSGRPIQVIADHNGEGGGSGSVDDDPRQYNFMIDSANVEWSFSVEEIVAADAKAPPNP